MAYGKALVSQVCPAGIPVEAFFGGLVELLDDELKKHGHDGVALPPGSYELLKANGVRLDLTRSFDDLGIEDGQTLVLVPVTGGASFEPQIESLSTALAVTAKGLGTLPDVVCDECGHKAGEREVANLLASKVDKMFRPITETTAAHVAIALVALAVTVVGALILRARTFTDNWVPATIAAGIGAVLVTAAVVSWRGWPDRRDLFSGFGWPAVGLLAIAGTCAPPGPLAAPHALIGLILLALGAITISVVSRSQTAVATAVVTLVSLFGVMAAVRSWHPVSARVLAVIVLLTLLVLIRMAPTIALWVARVRPPYFGSITGRDIFARRDGMPVDTVTPVGQDAEDEDDELTDTSTTGAQQRVLNQYVNAVQVGICVAVAMMLPVAVWMVLGPGRADEWEALVFAGIIAGVFITQGRGFGAKVQPIALVLGSCVAVLGGVLKYALAAPGNSVGGLLIPVLVIVVFTGLGLAAGLLVPAARFVPLVRLGVENLELLAIAVLGAIGADLGGLFTWFINW
ncbi:type VII secretion integral membrane protein EccD [Mycolicibacterium llatzerense]|nr:type VII secretion integral membrane protein EccD [Mycolicibacterium llatzerense]